MGFLDRIFGRSRGTAAKQEADPHALDTVLLTVARWAADCELDQRHVLVDGEPVELPTPPG